MQGRIIAVATLAATLYAPLSGATIVQFQTTLGNFEVNLYDEQTPETVANFLEYVNAGDYQNVVFHRSVSGFIVQGGGFVSAGSLPLDSLPANPAVVNEPEFSNVRGTIAMAKLAGNPNSATSQWFFNVADNSADLDDQNGGFTVFGEVTDLGMTVIDDINDLPIFNFGGALGELPLRRYSTQDYNDDEPVTDNHLILVSAIVVIDGAADTAAGLTPARNTLINAPPPAPNPPPAASGGGGGSADLLMLLSLLGLGFANSRSLRPRQ